MKYREGIRASASAVFLAAGLVAVVFGAVIPAEAGQARAQFTASIRIDPELVRRDLERLARSTAKDGQRVAARSLSGNAVRRAHVLPLAGGGTCYRKYVSAYRFRWICR